jgi:hypothetical protein
MKKTNKILASVGLVAAVALGVVNSAQATLLTATDATFGAFDSSSGTRSLVIGGAGSVGDVNLTIDFSKCDDQVGVNCGGGGYSFNREIVFRLTSPGGTTVNLVNQDTYTGQTPGARIVLTLDDEAFSGVGGSVLQSGSFQPVSALSAFDGQNAQGAWTLFIQDTVGADPLYYFSSTLDIQTRNNVPEPMTLALMGIGLAGVAASRKKAKA